MWKIKTQKNRKNTIQNSDIYHIYLNLYKHTQKCIFYFMWKVEIAQENKEFKKLYKEKESRPQMFT